MVSFRNGTLLGLGILVLATAAVAEDSRQPDALVGRAYVFPSSANAAGRFGAYYKTKMTIYNPSPEAITILASLSTPAGVTPTIDIVVTPNSFVRWDNFLADEFNYVGGAGINLFESSLSRSFIAVAEVYTESSNGRSSMPLTGLFTDDAVVTPGASISVVAGLRVDSLNRANYGCSSLSVTTAQIRADFYAFSNSMLAGNATTLLDLSPSGWAQLAVPVQGDDILAFFTVVSGSSGGDVYCYGVNVNNASNDGTSIPARTWPPVH